jgi:hypothetical protein
MFPCFGCAVSSESKVETESGPWSGNLLRNNKSTTFPEKLPVDAAMPFFLRRTAIVPATCRLEHEPVSKTKQRILYDEYMETLQAWLPTAHSRFDRSEVCGKVQQKVCDPAFHGSAIQDQGHASYRSWR